jgi:hypothetical protein
MFCVATYIRSDFLLYGFETWSLPLREEHRLRVFENRVLCRICGTKREEMVGSWRKLHNEFCNLYASPNIIRVIKSRRMCGKWGGKLWTGFIWLKIGTSGGLL